MIGAMDDPKSYDFLMVLVLWIGVHQGLLPFAAKLFGWHHPFLALTLRLPGPAWWIVSALVAIGSFVLLIVIDEAKKRRHPSA
jgi:hypothetical protein